MAIKNFLFLLAIVSLLSACQTGARRDNQAQQPVIFSQNSQAMQAIIKSPQVSTTDQPAVQAAAAPNNGIVVTGSTPVIAAPGEVLPVGIYLGPGAMRSFAHVGVLKALAQAQVPIVSIGGAEWGAVVAALYSFSKSANDVEWQMLKLRRDQLPGAGFMKKDIATGEDDALESYLRFVFADKNLENAKEPFICPTNDGVQNIFLRTGKAWEQLMKCTVIPPFYKPYQGMVSGAIGEGDWAEAMIKDGAKFIIYVDVLSEEPLFSKSHFENHDNAKIFWSTIKNLSHEQYRQANLIMKVPINEDLLDFDNRREAIKVGEKFATGVMPDLLKIIGVK